MAQLIFQRGEIYWVEFPSKIVGQKIHTIQEEHPAVIISNNKQNQFSPVLTSLANYFSTRQSLSFWNFNSFR